MDIPKNMKFGVAVALFKGKNVYLTQRCWNQLHYGNMWQIIYGFTSHDYERYADAAARLTKAEAGLDLKTHRFHFIKTQKVANELYYIYFVHLNEDETPKQVDAEQAKLHSNFTDFPLERAVNMLLVPTLEGILRKAAEAAEKVAMQNAVPERNCSESPNMYSYMSDYD